MEDLVTQLARFGLSEKEAEVYLSSLSLGFASMQDIAEKSGVNRATTYTAVEALERRGLMKSKVEEGKRLYVSESPERFRTLLCLQKKELEEKEREFLRLLPHVLMHAHPCGAKPGVKLFEGEDGKKTMMEMLCNADGSWLVARGQSSKSDESFFLGRDCRPPLRKNDSSGFDSIAPSGDFRHIVIVPGLGLKTIFIRDYFVAICLEDETQLSMLFISKDLADAMRSMLVK